MELCAIEKETKSMRRVAVLFLTLVCLVIPLNSSQTAPQQTAVQIKGIKDRITIRRDERGIPYIEAQNDEDLYFGQGYATAQDRLWQMDLFRRTARGELAEVLGAGPNNVAYRPGQAPSHLRFCASRRSRTRQRVSTNAHDAGSLCARC